MIKYPCSYNGMSVGDIIKYAGELMGLSGCGPTCLSMVCVYLLNDDTYTPEYVAEFAERNGYSVPGSSWRLISEG